MMAQQGSVLLAANRTAQSGRAAGGVGRIAESP